MKRIAVVGAGGSPAIGFERSLRAAPEPFALIGFDIDPYALQRAETDQRFLTPRPKDPDYLQVISGLLEETGADLLHVQVSAEMIAISGLRERLPCKTFLPRHETVLICEDKYRSYLRWQEQGLKVPWTLLLRNSEDLQNAFKNFGPRLWLRFTNGSAGRGSFATSNFEEAKWWIDYSKGWEKFTASECLERETVTWQSIWKEGELIVAQGRKRLFWEFGSRAPSGVTGITGAGVTCSDPQVDEISMRAILSIDPKPQGIFGVDLTYDRNGIPNPTEINIGRFFTTHQFFTVAGLNMPYIFVQCALNGPLPKFLRKVNPLPPGLVWIRGMDTQPILTTVEKINETLEELNGRRQRKLTSNFSEKEGAK